MISIVVVGIEHPANLGAICRAMANFGFIDLVLINPKCKKTDKDAILRAKHSAVPILQNARIADFTVLDTFDCIIGTTARNGTDYNIPRCPFTPEQMGEFIENNNLLKDKKIKTALLIGREGSGLTNQEIKRCDCLVTIPTHIEYPAMNISHAVGILLYEIHKKLGTAKIQEKFAKATAKEKEVIMRVFEDAIQKMNFKSENKRETQRQMWRRMVGKSSLTKREAFALIGFLRKI